MHMHLHVHCDCYKHNSATPFWVAAGGWRWAHGITSRQCIDWFPRTGYHAVLMVNQGVKLRIIYCHS